MPGDGGGIQVFLALADSALVILHQGMVAPDFACLPLQVYEGLVRSASASSPRQSLLPMFVHVTVPSVQLWP
jgi:hypothetical protein